MYYKNASEILEGNNQLLITMCYNGSLIGEYWVDGDDYTVYNGTLHVSIGEGSDLYIPLEKAEVQDDEIKIVLGGVEVFIS